MSYKAFRLFFVLILMFGQVRSAQALAPDNDQFASAETIASLPYSVTVDVSEATLESDEPQACQPADRTVWYTFVPSATMIMIADARQGNGPNISIYRAAGSGITNLEHVQCVSPGGAVTFQVEAGQTYYIQAGAVTGAPGTVQFSLSEVVEITGYVVDAVTGAPLPGNVPPFATVSLLRVCGDGCLEIVRGVVTFDDGQFRIQSYFGDEIPPGTYMIEVSASGYQTRQVGPFEFSGANLDIGTLALDPVPAIGSIRGRLLDPATGKPVPPSFFPTVYLYRCTDVDCFEFINALSPDSEGRFRFETDTFGNRLTVGKYQVYAYADQYQPALTEIFELGEGAHHNVATLRIRSNPVRFSDVVPCPELPPSGGECEYSVRIWNGLGGRLEGNAWSLTAIPVPESFIGFTEFQTKVPTELILERGKSKVFHFKFKVPAGNASAPLGICTRAFVGRGGNAFFNTIGYMDLFCVIQNTDGYAISPPIQRELLMPKSALNAASGTEAEPNDSCPTAQDLGAVTLPFTMDGNLDSSLAPDVDFYRFTSTAGAPLIIDHEGEATGKGTLFDPLVGAFDSNCNLIALNDDSSNHNARLTMETPADGVVIIAATEYPDYLFVGGGNGTYQLTLTTYSPVGSISGRVIDFATGAPLTGDGAPFASVYLQQCNELGCFDISWQPAASDGSFRFERDFSGAPLTAGTYVIAAFAEQYLFSQTEQFTVDEGEDIDVGEIGLTSFPAQFSDPQVCAIPSGGGVCDFTVKMTNTLATPLSGKVWSIVNGFDMGSFINFTAFQTDTPQDLSLGGGQSRTLHFRFRVSGRVADGAYICPTVYMGQNPNALFNPVGRSFLFCLVKGDGGFMLISPEEAQTALQQMKLKEMAPTSLPSEKKK